MRNRDNESTPAAAAPDSRVRTATKPARQLTSDDRDLALAFLEASRALHESGDPDKTLSAKFRDAAKRANVPEPLLRDWAAGGMAGVLDLTALPIEYEEYRRPQPPAYLLDEDLDKALFVPAHDAWEWMKAVFVEEGAPLYNEAHWHLLTAKIGVLWTNVESRRSGKRIWGTCESLSDGSKLWAQARAEMQIRGWFGETPDFLITIDATLAARDNDRTFCSGCEHELLHAGVKLDRYDQPRFDDEGRPAYGIRKHDAEEFVDCADRYGLGSLAGQTDELVAAANKRPRWTDEDIALACGEPY